jgi:hypothetical protein
MFLEGEDTALLEKFDAAMKSAFPVDKIKEARVTLTSEAGIFKQQVGTRTQKYQDYDIVFVTCEFESMMIDFQVVFGKDGKVAGFFSRPAEYDYVPPAYVNTSSFHEYEVTVGSGEWALPGTLTIPAGNGPFPAVVLVHGSGPNDRDETIGPNKPFRDLAWGLATQGIAVLRYDKRTKVYGAKIAAASEGFTVQEEVVDDALAAVTLLRQTEAIDTARIYILGHSLGGMLIPRIGAANPQVAGFIILAGPSRSLEDLILEQSTYLANLDGTISSEERDGLAVLSTQVVRVKDPALSEDTPATELLNAPPGYWLDLQGYHPAETAKTLEQPILILQGERDYQVTLADYDGWKAALSSRPSVSFKLYPDLNHLFIQGQGISTPAEYQVAGHVAEQVVVDIANWILQR